MNRHSIVVVDDFYRRPHEVRRFALAQQFYTPYEPTEAVRSGAARPTWWASKSQSPSDCPFKPSQSLMGTLEAAVGETIDLEHWKSEYPTDGEGRPLGSAVGRACLWNCCFHIKPENGQRLGDGVHNHVVDTWNSVGPNGWAGIVYLTPSAPLDGGLHLWHNRDPQRQFDWMTPTANWQLVDSFGNVFNRLILVRGDVPHSGAAGWGHRLEEGRLYQTFFFRTLLDHEITQVSIPEIGA